MKVIFLNIWGGRIFDPFMSFVKESASSTDFFCFQEMVDSSIQGITNFGGRADIRKKLAEALPEFQEYYEASHNALDKEGKPDPATTIGVAIFSKKNIEIKSKGRIHVQGDAHYLQYVRFEHDKKTYTLANMHGTAYPGSKLDTPERLEQSKRIVDFLAEEKGDPPADEAGKILGGDFNLLPETESIKMIEKTGMRSLIKEYRIKTTRSVLNYARYPENERQYFSDYAFVSSDVQVTNFGVPQLNISDHLPLILEFS